MYHKAAEFFIPEKRQVTVNFKGGRSPLILDCYWWGMGDMLNSPHFSMNAIFRLHLP